MYFEYNVFNSFYSNMSNSVYLIRRLLQEASDLVLHCLKNPPVSYKQVYDVERAKTSENHKFEPIKTAFYLICNYNTNINNCYKCSINHNFRSINCCWQILKTADDHCKQPGSIWGSSKLIWDPNCLTLRSNISKSLI